MVFSPDYAASIRTYSTLSPVCRLLNRAPSWNDPNAVVQCVSASLYRVTQIAVAHRTFHLAHYYAAVLTEWISSIQYSGSDDRCRNIRRCSQVCHGIARCSASVRYAVTFMGNIRRHSPINCDPPLRCIGRSLLVSQLRYTVCRLR